MRFMITCHIPMEKGDELAKAGSGALAEVFSSLGISADELKSLAELGQVLAESLGLCAQGSGFGCCGSSWLDSASAREEEASRIATCLKRHSVASIA